MATIVKIRKEPVDARINVRLRSDIKERIERAAVISGKSLTDFAITTLAKTAEEVLEKHQETALSDRDRDIFLKMLSENAIPNAKLRRAAKTHKRLITA